MEEIVASETSGGYTEIVTSLMKVSKYNVSLYIL